MTVTDAPTAAEAPEASAAAPAEPTGPPAPTVVEAVLGGSDHKVVGRMWIASGLVFLVVDLIFSTLLNADIAGRASLDAVGWLQPDLATRFAYNTPLMLLLCGLIPVLIGLGTYLVPLQVGSPIVAFPRAAAAAFWGWLLTSIIFIITVVANGSYGGTNTNAARLGNVAVGALLVTLAVAATCVAVTVLNLRAEGMTLRRVPMFAWSMFVAGSLWVLTFASALARVVLIHIQRPTPDIVTAGWADIGWLFHQPALYLAAIPILGIAADIVPVMARTPQRAAGAVQAAIGAFGFLSFGAWTQGIDGKSTAVNTIVWVAFALAAILPVLGVIGGLADTIQHGRPQVTAALGCALVSQFLLLLAGLSGALAAIATAGKGNWFEILDVPPSVGMSIGQFQLVAGAVVVGALGALLFWGPKLWGNLANETIGRALLLIANLGALLYGASHAVLGLTAPGGDGYRAFAAIAAAGAALLALTVLGLLSLAAAAARFSDSGPGDPWGGFTLEWSVPFPPPPGNFETPPTVSSATPLHQQADEPAKGGN